MDKKKEALISELKAIKQPLTITMRKAQGYKNTVTVRIEEIDTLRIDVETKIFFPQYRLQENWFYFIRKTYKKQLIKRLFCKIFNLKLKEKVKTKTFPEVSQSVAFELFRICELYVAAVVKVSELKKKDEDENE